jgi:hypothetical protein
MQPFGTPITVEEMRPNMLYEITYEQVFLPHGRLIIKTFIGKYFNSGGGQISFRVKKENIGMTIKIINTADERILFVRPLNIDFEKTYLINAPNHVTSIIQGQIDTPFHLGECIVRVQNQNTMIYMNVYQITSLEENLANNADARLMLPAMQSGLDANTVFALADAAEDINSYRGGRKLSYKRKQKSRKQRKN